jgi:hypothetical protein
MMTRFAEAADLWLAKLDDMERDGRRSSGTVETYRRQLVNHILRTSARSGSVRQRRLVDRSMV